MSDKKNKKVRGFKGSGVYEWNSGGQTTDVKNQNPLNSDQNQYQHTTAQKEQTQEVTKEYSIVLRGNCNHAPQKDIELGKRSITHRAIADRLAYLNAGKKVEFYIEDPENEDGQLTDDEQLELEIAEEFLDNGLQDSIKQISNGLTYQNLSSVVVTQNVRLNGGSEDMQVTLSPEYFVAHPSEELRFSKPRLNEFAKKVVDFHYYHKDWLFDPKQTAENEKSTIPKIVPIREYIQDQDKNKDAAFAVRTCMNEQAKQGRFVSFPFTLGEGIFDNSYPLPSWKTDSSINDIQSEFESSCIRIDYLRNGLHVFAMVNVYSMLYNDMTEDEAVESATDKFVEDMQVIKALKGSFAAGRVVVNALSTEDPEKDGKMEIQEINLNFDTDGVRYFNEEARAAALTAWGVMADLFSISKPEKSNLRSQGEFLKIGILLLHEKIRTYQVSIEKGIDKILKWYGLEKVRTKILPHDSNVYLAVMAEFAKDQMDINEIREKILNLPAKTMDEIDELLSQRRRLIFATETREGNVANEKLEVETEEIEEEIEEDNE